MSHHDDASAWMMGTPQNNSLYLSDNWFRQQQRHQEEEKKEARRSLELVAPTDTNIYDDNPSAVVGVSMAQRDGRRGAAGGGGGGVDGQQKQQRACSNDEDCVGFESYDLHSNTRTSEPLIKFPTPFPEARDRVGDDDCGCAAAAAAVPPDDHGVLSPAAGLFRPPLSGGLGDSFFAQPVMPTHEAVVATPLVTMKHHDHNNNISNTNNNRQQQQSSYGPPSSFLTANNSRSAQQQRATPRSSFHTPYQAFHRIYSSSSTSTARNRGGFIPSSSSRQHFNIKQSSSNNNNSNATSRTGFASSSSSSSSSLQQSQHHHVIVQQPPASRAPPLPRPAIIAAVIDNRAGDVGIALLSVSNMRLVLAQFGDTASFSQTVAHLTAHRVTEIIVAHTTVNGRLAKTLYETFSSSAVDGNNDEDDDGDDVDDAAGYRYEKSSNSTPYPSSQYQQQQSSGIGCSRSSAAVQMFHVARKYFSDTRGAARISALHCGVCSSSSPSPPSSSSSSSTKKKNDADNDGDDAVGSSATTTTTTSTAGARDFGEVTSESYLAIACANALIEYVQSTMQLVFFPRTMQIVFAGATGCVSIDRATAKALRLFSLWTKRDISSAASSSSSVDPSKASVTSSSSSPIVSEVPLAQRLDHTTSLCGRRLLRSNILQPPSSIESIRDRQETVSFLALHMDDMLMPIRRSFLPPRRAATTNTTTSSNHPQQQQQQYRPSSDDGATATVFDVDDDNYNSNPTGGRDDDGDDWKRMCSLTHHDLEVLLGVLMYRNSSMDRLKLLQINIAAMLNLRSALAATLRVSDALREVLASFSVSSSCSTHQTNDGGGGDKNKNNLRHHHHHQDDPSSPYHYTSKCPRLLVEIDRTLRTADISELCDVLDEFIDAEAAQHAALHHGGRGDGGGALANLRLRLCFAFRENAATQAAAAAAAAGAASVAVAVAGAPVNNSNGASAATATATTTADVSILTVVRRRINDTIESMIALCERLKRDHNVGTLRITSDVRRGFHFAIDTQEVATLPRDVFFSIHQCSSSRALCTCTDMICLNRELDDAFAECLCSQEHILNRLLRIVHLAMARLHSVADSVALLDMLCSLSIHASMCFNNNNNSGGGGSNHSNPATMKNHAAVVVPQFRNTFVLENFRSVAVNIINPSINHNAAAAAAASHHQQSASLLHQQNRKITLFVDTLRQQQQQQQQEDAAASVTTTSSGAAGVPNSSMMTMGPASSSGHYPVVRSANSCSQRNFVLPSSDFSNNNNNNGSSNGDDPPAVADSTFSSPTKAMIVTGPNASGKSVLLRDIAHLSIIAHMGGLLPAATAILPLLDSIYYRDSADASPSTARRAVSRFTHDLRETGRILRSVTPRSLVLLDELGRGTSSREGAAVAASVTGYLAAEKRCFTVLATHHTSLASALPAKFPRLISSMQMQVETTSSGDLIARYGVVPGACQISQYGILLAQTAGMPRSIVQNAVRIHQVRSMDNENNNNNNDRGGGGSVVVTASSASTTTPSAVVQSPGDDESQAPSADQPPPLMGHRDDDGGPEHLHQQDAAVASSSATPFVPCKQQQDSSEKTHRQGSSSTPKSYRSCAPVRSESHSDVVADAKKESSSIRATVQQQARIDLNETPLA